MLVSNIAKKAARFAQVIFLTIARSAARTARVPCPLARVKYMIHSSLSRIAYEYRAAPIALFRRRSRGKSLRQGGGPPAHDTAAAVPDDTGAGSGARYFPVRTHPAKRSADACRRSAAA